MAQTYLESWYQNASIRKKPHILLSDNKLPFFPEELLPFCNHELISHSATINKEYILLQVCYKYLQEVCITETDVVNPICLKIAYGDIPVHLDEATKADAFSIMADEAFHSYVARNFMLQIERHTGISPIMIPKENEITKAIDIIKQKIEPEMRADFELAATCISENVFTDEIIEISRFKNVNESFHQVMVEHARDEGRHANYFVKIMKAYWEQANETQKALFVKIIPEFIDLCFDGIHDADFIKKLLVENGLKIQDVKNILVGGINETTRQNRQARINNIVKFFKRSGMLSYRPLVEALQLDEMLCPA